MVASTRIRIGWLGGMAATLLVLVPAAAFALPASLRSEADLEQVAETFMSNVVAHDLRAAYRAAAPFWPAASQHLAALISAAESRRKDLRKTLGLSLGYERLALERVGDRLVRLSYLERFDAGGRLWRFLFYRADTAWQLLELEESDDLSGLFAPP